MLDLKANAGTENIKNRHRFFGGISDEGYLRGTIEGIREGKRGLNSIDADFTLEELELIRKKVGNADFRNLLKRELPDQIRRYVEQLIKEGKDPQK